MQIIYLREADKSRYFAITELNNFLLSFDQQVFIFKSFSDSLLQRSDLSFFTEERSYNYAWAECYLQQNTCADHF